MKIDDRIKLREQLVEAYDQWIANAEDLTLKQYFIEEKIKIEQRINEFWVRKVLLSNPKFSILIAPQNTNIVVCQIPMSSPTEEQARQEIGEALLNAFSMDGLRLYDGEFTVIVVRNSLYNKTERKVAEIMNDNEAYVTSAAFRVEKGGISWI